MKIDAFALDLSSSRTYSETQTSHISRRFSFVDLMDSRMETQHGHPGQNRILVRGSGAAIPTGSAWYTPVSVDGQQAVSLTDHFMAELENMRQIMSAVMDAVQKRMPITGVCRMTQIGEIYVMPVAMGRFSTVRAWEYTQSLDQTYEEYERTTVSAGGSVKTADNREIDFSFDLEMERQFFRADYVEQTATGYALIDPLMVRTDARAPLLSGGQFSFDLDMDGTEEDLPMPGPGYGFLSLDVNQDGRINDGSELFGPSTGNGFAELAAYDLDHNLWIDENDGIFDQLTLWEQGDEGMTLTRIKDAGIGAIYLAGVPSQFDLTTDDNALLGRVARTSIALTESGEALPVQEVDYASVQEEENIA